MLKIILQWLAQKLYPNGRAFRMPSIVNDPRLYVTEDGTEGFVDEDGVDFFVAETAGADGGGNLFRLHRSLNINLATAWTDAAQIHNDLLPDNDNFTIEDAHDWYRRLGIFDSGTVPLADMKLAIAQKLSFPLVPRNKQNYLYIEEQLRAAGFDVHIYENRFSDGMGGWITKRPEEIFGTSAGAAIHASTVYHGNIQHGAAYGTTWSNKVVNYIEEAKDATFDVGDNFKSTFYVAGATVDTFADIDEDRKIEFRQLLLKYKRAETCALLFVNYI